MLYILGLHFSYWIVALVISVYFGIRGFFYTRSYRNREMEKMKGWEKILVYYIQDVLYNFVCGIAGFISFSLLLMIWPSFEKDLSAVSAGSAVLFGILGFTAILGMSGTLPRILSRFGIPKA